MNGPVVVCHKAVPGPSTELQTLFQALTRASKESFNEQLIYFELDNVSVRYQEDLETCSKLIEHLYFVLGGSSTYLYLMWIVCVMSSRNEVLN